jgi:hypothetical protein
VGRETASLLIATVRAVPWTEHADEAVENLPIIRNAKQLWVRNYPVMASTSTRAPWCSGKNERSIILRKKILMVVLLFLMPGTLMAQEPEVTPLVSKGVEVEFESTDVESPGSEPRVIQQGRKTRRSTTHERTVNLGNTSHISINH